MMQIIKVTFWLQMLKLPTVVQRKCMYWLLKI